MSIETDANPQALFNQTLALYQQGRLADAESTAARLLKIQPEHFDALHLSGVIAASAQRGEQAVQLLNRAIASNPNVAAAHRHLGNALRDLGRWQQALASYDQAIALRPDFAEAHFSRGTALRALGRLDDALASFDRGIALRPGDVPAHNARTAALLELQRPEAALVSSERAIALAPGSAAAHCNRAAALKELKRFDEALGSCDRAIALQADLLVAHLNRGAVLRELQRHDEALASYDLALELRPDCAEAYANRAIVLQDLQRTEDALASCERALALQPDLALAHVNRGSALHDLLRLDAALASYAEAARLQPDNARAVFNAGLIHLQTGQYESGWQWHERRKKPHVSAGSGALPQPFWTGGEPLEGRTLLCCWEQGLGDTIQFCRYARLAADRGAHVVLLVQGALRSLLQGLHPAVEVFAEARLLPAFDLQCPLLSLPLAFGTTVESIPAAVPYLSAEPARVALWRERIGVEGFKIDICWQGNPSKAVDSGRSFPLRLYQPLSLLPSVRLISLQKGPGASQLSSLPAGMRVETLGAHFDLDLGPDAFLDSAAVMANMDLIISSDTSVAHLAGALARPAWIALKRVPDWRWMLDREDSPWYPTVRLFRQDRAGDWAGVFSRMARELEPLLRRQPRGANPASPSNGAMNGS
jgi:tetratricopeptide (TPR) repeat protein